MKEANNLVCSRIEPGHVWPLEPIAMDTSQGEVLKFCFASMLSRNYVIDLEWRWVKRGVQLTVFATAPCAFPNLSNEICIQNVLLSGTLKGAASF
jgi:hypothetical protein